MTHIPSPDNPALFSTPSITRVKLFDPDNLLLRGGSIPIQAAGKHPIGFNVRPGVDYGRLLEQVKRMGGCRAMLFHEYQGALDKLHAFRNWVDTIIWRPAHFESETLYQQTDADTWVSGRRLEMLAAGWDPGDLWLHLHNEAGWSPTMIEWE